MWILKKVVPWKPVIATLISQQTTKELNEKKLHKTPPLDERQELHKIPRLQNIDLNLLTITFHLSLFTKPAPL